MHNPKSYQNIKKRLRKSSFIPFIKQKLATISCVVLLIPASTYAHDKATAVSQESEIISKVINAYGGEALINAKSIKVLDYNKGPWPGESEIPGEPEIWRINEELIIDFENKKKGLLSYRAPRTTLDLEKWIHDGKKTVMYDILHNKYSVEEWASYEWLGSSLIRSSDTLQARRLHTDLKSAQYIGNEYYRGKVHQKLAITLSSGTQFTYFIDITSGLIRKIQRSHPRIGNMLYVFSNHQTVNKVVFAQDLNFFINGTLRITSVERNIELNPNITRAFKGFDNFTQWGDTFNYSDLHIEKRADGVYQVGKGRALSVFIEHSDYYIALGAANAIENNFAEIKKRTHTDKPIQYFIVTHHHNANLQGLDKVLALGAKLVFSDAHKSVITESLSSKHSADDFVVVPDRTPFNIGNLTLSDIATAHAQHYLLVYFPKHKMVFAEDHYVTNLKTAKPRIYHDMVRFAQALDELNIDVEKLIDIRGWRQLNIADFKRWTRDFTAKTCPKDYAICTKG
ncbi:hypothetical protein PSECIP111854_01026 [Pseudoalteromonas sp. CIP111854]|uniref:MBL fold metallo-hydrolase n=1 Tax=Pseudoalteromonas holothuriae TaxID=2963714 RepID=A0A9W4QTN4_9GAMM|nr:hypothetical protein [Pseudoalteromonas sp. CIP111854]CAH9052711.1 hypothetical protein PSECIP111854_01026 [Pseudoalteromonas sp. CIP111854]